ncbi:MAG: rod shape-determining protein RodA [Gammaproteobacteria bacterium]|nr:rod shape-determining protein RodA [Gammaproteobacteria bacterium]
MRTASEKDLFTRVHLDGPLFSGVVLLCALGLIVLYSASGESSEVVLRQAMRMLLGLVAMCAIAHINPGRLARWAPLFYGAGMALLIAVFLFGTGRGAHRWLEMGFIRFQPSEIMKLAVPLTVAWFLSDKVLPPTVSTVAIVLMLIAIPGAFVIEQPDLGTAILIMMGGLLVLFFAGLAWRWTAIAAAVSVVCAPIGWYLMHDYQRQRIITLLDPTQDPLGSGYHIIQATIAVGSGGLSGKGWLNGTQSHLEFLPERATDFIFAVYCEEFGLLGVVVLLAAYSLILARGLTIAFYAQDIFGRLVAASLTFTLFIYVFVNMGMVTGQLPVVGVPLPLISYGGTSIVTLMTGFGILMSIQTHRRFIVES